MPPINATLGFSEQRRRSQIQLFSTNYSLLVQTPTVIKSKAQISDDEFHAHLEKKNTIRHLEDFWLICGTNRFNCSVLV